LPFTASAKVLNFKGDLFTETNQKAKIKIVLSRTWTDNKPTWFGKAGKISHTTEEEFDDEVEINNGIIEFKFTPVPENTKWFRIELKYKNAESSNHYYKPESVSDQFLRAFTKPNNNEITVEVFTTEAIKNLTYQIMSMNEVIVSKSLDFIPTKENSFNVAISEKYRLAEIKVFVFYIRENGEVVFDLSTVQCNGSLNNSIEMEMSNEIAKPSEEIEFSIESKEKSVIGLFAVDKSVLLMKSNDFTKNDIVSKLKSMTYANHYNSSYRYESTIVDEFDAFFLTNAKTGRELSETPIYRCGGAPRMMKMMARNDFVMADDMQMAPQMAAFGAAPERNLVGMAMGGEADSTAEIKVRKDFPETWFFDLIKTEDGLLKFKKKIPDTITSWIINGFSMSSIHGLGMLESPKSLKVFQPFFVTANIPYSIKRGEIVNIQFLVSNYLETSQKVQLTFFNEDDEFEFQENCEGKELTKIVEINANSVASEKFKIKPLKVGRMKIKVRAMSDNAGDIIEQFLLVKPEGICHFKNNAFIINLKEKNEFNNSLKIEMPKEVVEGSKRVEVSIIGDIMGPALENLDNLIRIPYGCGEQNMLNFVPNIIVLDYLKNMQKVTPIIYAKAKAYMEKGYQSELTYKHHNGSYSAFGMNDKTGCTWLTAFVVKSFYKARNYINIDEDIIAKACEFLCGTQQSNGSFVEVGSLFHKEMQGGASSGVALTSYIVTAFLENPNYKENPKYVTAVENGLRFVAENLDKAKDNYSLSIVAYTFQKANHPMKDLLIEKLEKAAINRETKYWTVDGFEQSTKDSPRSLNIEMTAYALQTYLEAKRDVDVFHIMKWLISQRNSKGGFYSTQDTIVGLEALSKAAVLVCDNNKNIDINVKYGNDTKNSKFSVNNENAMVLQSHLLSTDTENVEVQAIGQGICVVQLAHQYHISEAEKNAFNLQADVSKLEGTKLIVKVIVSFDSEKKSNMAVVEIELPSGFVYDKDFESKLQENQLVKRVETKEGDTSVAVYFDEMGNSQNVLEFHAIKSHDVSNLKPADVKVYDYYDNGKKN
jgi:CD109 antigen